MTMVLLKEYIGLILMWCAWCAIHSGMISLNVTDGLKTRLGDRVKYYRLFYNLFALTTIVPLIIYGQNLKGEALFRWDGWLAWVQAGLLVIVMVLFAAGGRKYDMLQFLGLRQIHSSRSHATLTASGDLDTSGILSLTRHPWYLAAIIFVWVDSREMTVSTLIVNIILTIYVIVGTVLEERKLVRELGDQYRDYQAKVSMLSNLLLI